MYDRISSQWYVLFISSEVDVIGLIPDIQYKSRILYPPTNTLMTLS